MYKFLRIILLAILILLALFSGAKANFPWLSMEYFIDFDLPEYQKIENDKLQSFINRLDKKIDAEEAPNPEILYVVARTIQDGEDPSEEDLIKSEKYLILASEADHKQSQLALAVYYNYKNEVTKAKKWFKDAAAKEDINALLQLGIKLRSGLRMRQQRRT